MDEQISDVQLLKLIQGYTQQLKDDPNSECFLPLAQGYDKLGLLDAALSAIKGGLVHHPDNLQGQIMLAQFLCKNSQFDDSVTTYEKILQQTPDCVEALIGMARLSMVQEHYQRAEEYFQRAQTLAPDHALVVAFATEMGVNVEIDADIDNDDDPLAVVTATMAELYIKQGLQEKAVDVYQILLKQQPDNRIFRARLNELLGVDEVANELPISLMTKLECWLDAIDRRRKHV
jgi:tetratricopeptide (TPR) repeat protein